MSVPIPEWEINDGPFDPEDEPTPEEERKFQQWLDKEFYDND